MFIDNSWLYYSGEIQAPWYRQGRNLAEFSDYNCFFLSVRYDFTP